MTTAGETRDLSWFTDLPPDERVALLSNPRQNLPGPLVERLLYRQNQPRVFGTWWVASSDPVSWALASDAADQLKTVRKQLDRWWDDILKADERTYIVQHRAGVLAGNYAEAVQAATTDPVSPGTIVVVVARDASRGGEFRLPPIIRTYVDLHAGSTTT